MTTSTWPPRGTRLAEVDVLDSTIAYLRGGDGPTVLFVHGNPTSSYLWRHVISELADVADCVAVDLIGMGRSGKPSLDYGFADHARYLEAFADRMGLRDVVYVGHDWGAVLGLDLLRRRPDLISRIAVCEGHLRPFDDWGDMDEGAADLFSRLRTPGTGERLVLRENFFVEQVLPAGMDHTLTDAERNAYRAPFLEESDRLPVLRWIQQIPVAGDPPLVDEIVRANQHVLLHGPAPRLLLHGTPGSVVGPAVVDHFRREATGLETADVGPGTHFLPEDQPGPIASAIRRWAGL